MPHKHTRHLHITPTRLIFAVFVAVITTGAILGASANPDDRWIGWHFSRLGEGPSSGAMVFNIFMMLGAGLMLLLARGVHAKMHALPKRDVNHPHFAPRLFVLLAISFAGIALFPFDRFEVVHNLFGYFMVVYLGAMVLGLRRAMPMFSPTFHTISKIWLVISALIYFVLFIWLSTITLTMFELYVCVTGIAWLWYFFTQIDTSNRKKRA